MSPETPKKERLSFSPRPAMPALLRSAIAAIVLSCTVPAVAAPQEQKPATPYTNTDKEKQNETAADTAPAICMINGYLKMQGNKLVARTLCYTEKNRLVLKNTVLLPDEEKHYKIPGTEAYFYIGANGGPILSFMQEGKWALAMPRKTKDGEFSFEMYIDLIYPDPE